MPGARGGRVSPAPALSRGRLQQPSAVHRRRLLAQRDREKELASNSGASSEKPAPAWHSWSAGPVRQFSSRALITGTPVPSAAGQVPHSYRRPPPTAGELSPSRSARVIHLRPHSRLVRTSPFRAAGQRRQTRQCRMRWTNVGGSSAGQVAARRFDTGPFGESKPLRPSERFFIGHKTRLNLVPNAGCRCSAQSGPAGAARPPVDRPFGRNSRRPCLMVMGSAGRRSRSPWRRPMRPAGRSPFEASIVPPRCWKGNTSAVDPAAEPGSVC